MEIRSVTIPFFALVLIGYLAARWHALPLTAVPGLNTYVLYFALSAMLFQLGARTPVAELGGGEGLSGHPGTSLLTPRRLPTKHEILG